MSWLKKQFKKLKNRVTTSPWDRIRVNPYDRIRGDWTEGSGGMGTDFAAQREAALNRNPSLIRGAVRNQDSITGWNPTTGWGSGNTNWTPRAAGPGIQAIDPSLTSSYGNTRVGGTWSTPSSQAIEEQNALLTPQVPIPSFRTQTQSPVLNSLFATKTNPVDSTQYQMYNGKMNPVNLLEPTKDQLGTLGGTSTTTSSNSLPSSSTYTPGSSAVRNLFSPGYQDVTAQTTLDNQGGAFQWQDMNMDHVFNPGEEYDPRSSVWNGWMNQQDAVQNPTTPTTSGTGYVPTTQAQQDYQNASTYADWSGDPLTQAERDSYAATATPKKTWKTERAAGNDWLGDIF